MSRTCKTGLDYFPLDVDFYDDQKIEFVAAKYGAAGENIVIKLLCRIYRNGYYIQWGDDEALLFAKRCDTELDIVDGVINELLKRGFLSEKLHLQFGILTSNGIQKRYLEATRRRKGVSIYKEFLVADAGGYDVDILPLDVDIYPQSKVKESKEEKSKEEYMSFFNTFWKEYPKKQSKPDAIKAFKSLKVDDILLGKILDGLAKWRQSDQWTKGYIPNPATWIRGRRWEDEDITLRQSPQSQPTQYTKDTWNADLEEEG